MAWCEDNGVDYVFGLPGAKPLAKKVDEAADAVRTERAVSDKPVVRGYAETRHKAKSWSRERRAVARIEATPLGLDIRFVVTNVAHGAAEWIYDSLYCARGQMENLIKLHKTQLASDRTSCRSAIANQVRLVLHTAAYWLMLTVRDAIPKIARSGQGRVLDFASASDQDRRPRHRNRKPRASRLRRRLARKPICSAACPAPWRHSDRDRRGMRPFQSSRSLKRVPENYRSSRGEKPNGAARPNSNNPKSSAGKPAFMNKGG